MLKLARLLLAMCLVLPPVVGAKTLYVTDKVLVGVYEEPDTNSRLLKSIPTGTPLEILEKKGKLARVRTSDGFEGWLDSTYTIDHKPAQHVVLELADKQKQTEEELEKANRRAASLEKDVQQLKIKNRSNDANNDDSSAIKKALAEREAELKAATTTINDLNGKLADLQKAIDDAASKPAETSDAIPQANITDLQQQLAAKQQTIDALNQRIQAVSQALGQEVSTAGPVVNANNQFLWLAIGIISALVLGFLIAFLIAQRSSMRRHGGFRIHLNT